MNLESILTSAVGLLGVLGGWEGIKYLINRKSHKRIAESEADKKETEADTDEFHLLREALEFLQGQLQQKEERFAEQTTLVRTLNKEVMELTQKKGALELEHQKLKCVVPKCLKRDPQNGY